MSDDIQKMQNRQAADAPIRVGCLVDTTRCVGCRSCQTACKMRHGHPADEVEAYNMPGGYQTPSAGCTANTRTFISFHERVSNDAERSDSPTEENRRRWVFIKRQCMHCTELRCNRACRPDLFSHTKEGIVEADAETCIGCGACLSDCPFAAVAVAHWDSETPILRKCSFCFETAVKLIDPADLDADTPPADPFNVESSKKELPPVLDDPHRVGRIGTPACATACPARAMLFGPREQLLAEARRRIAQSPDRYHEKIYGETECGGMAWLYLLPCAPETLGLPIYFSEA